MVAALLYEVVLKKSGSYQKKPLINVLIQIKSYNFYLIDICVIQKISYEVNITLKIVAGSNKPQLLSNP